MDLIPIKDYEGLYSLDKNNNQVYSHIRNRYLKSNLTNRGYYYIDLCKNSKRKRFLFHRLIYQVYNPNIDITNLEIDHIDNNQLNNNIENLRHCNRSENICNTKVHKNNLLGIKNIYLTPCDTYSVKIEKNKKTYNKNFKTLEEAIEYRDNKLIELHNEFHNLG